MSRATGGGMAAVLGVSEEGVAEILRENGLDTIDIANLNAPTQIVVSGPSSDIEKAAGLFGAAGAIYVPLKVSAAFHSRYMESAKKEFKNYLGRFKLSEPGIPVISNVRAGPYKKGQLKENLIEQITSSVKWTESVRYLMGLGEMDFVGIGTGDVLTKLVKRIREQAEPLVIETEAKLPPARETPPKKVAAVTEKPEPEGFIIQELDTGLQEPQERQEQLKLTERNLSLRVAASSLGDEGFKKDYNLKFAYLTGAMHRGIASKEMVVKMGRAGMMGFFGSGGLELKQLEETIQYVQNELSDGTITGNTRIMAKISRPEVAEAFLSQAPEHIVEKLLVANTITREQAELLKEIPVANDLCAEADSGGHTDAAVAYALLPAIIKLRDEMMKKHGYRGKVRVGAAGGIGTPGAAAAAFIMGADFILTGSINQCTVEAATSDAVKDLLQQMNVQDTDYAPAGDMLAIPHVSH